jgi:hypothetical protein
MEKLANTGEAGVSLRSRAPADDAATAIGPPSAINMLVLLSKFRVGLYTMSSWA